MPEKRVLILQENEESCRKIKDAVTAAEGFRVIGCFTDGEKAVVTAIEEKPDFVITELVLSGCDGMTVIERVKEDNPETRVIVLSAISREEVIVKATEKGADYYMAKPINGEQLIRSMKEPKEKEKAREIRKETLDEQISRIFINVGIPPHIKGYAFLREGVKLAVENPMIINSITKALYPKIGEKYGTSASKVERAIRHAIEVAWNRGRIESINGILGVRAYVGAEKPTNGEFIALVADKMLLERL